jgi:ABC-type antimicrobial peptide transport system permease subunit
MFRNNFKIAWRNITKQKMFSFIQIGRFALAGGIVLVIALATVIFQSIKAATANPVESLRYE